MTVKWTPFCKISRTMQVASMGIHWTWTKNSRCKYVNIRIDMRDGMCVISDRNGKVITLDELEFQYGGDNDNNS